VGGDQDAAIWYSTNGATWNRELSTAAGLGGDNAQAINTIGQHGGTLVAVGSDASGGSEHAQVWDAETPPSGA
jgi:hypothetical protein